MPKFDSNHKISCKTFQLHLCQLQFLVSCSFSDFFFLLLQNSKYVLIKPKHFSISSCDRECRKKLPTVLCMGICQPTNCLNYQKIFKISSQNLRQQIKLFMSKLQSNHISMHHNLLEYFGSLEDLNKMHIQYKNH